MFANRITEVTEQLEAESEKSFIFSVSIYLKKDKDPIQVEYEVEKTIPEEDRSSTRVSTLQDLFYSQFGPEPIRLKDKLQYRKKFKKEASVLAKRVNKYIVSHPNYKPVNEVVSATGV